MLQAMNTGHDGSLTTVHANSPRDALSRIETMIAMAGLELPQRAVRSQIASAIDVVIQLVRLSDGKRKLVGLEEITGMEGEVVTMQEIFTLERHGIDEGGQRARRRRTDRHPPALRARTSGSRVSSCRKASSSAAAATAEREDPMSPILYVLVFLTAMLALEGVYFMLRERSGRQKAASDRLERISRSLQRPKDDRRPGKTRSRSSAAA